MNALPRPTGSEHHEHYRRYVELVPDGDIVETLRTQLEDTLDLLRRVPVEKETFRYAEGKWSLREVVGHLIDEWELLRRANLWMFSSFDAEAGARIGFASGHQFTVRSSPWIIAGHELCHRSLIVRDYLG